jgi:hypothetical protein
MRLARRFYAKLWAADARRDFDAYYIYDDAHTRALQLAHNAAARAGDEARNALLWVDEQMNLFNLK